jgi:hypothetical protein
MPCVAPQCARVPATAAYGAATGMCVNIALHHRQADADAIDGVTR